MQKLSARILDSAAVAEMNLLFIFLLMPVVLLDLGFSFQFDDCKADTCGGSDYPPIRYPFRVKDRQPKHCGYPGFDLSCSETHDTVLELPNSTKLYIKNINYVRQQMDVTAPDGCLGSLAKNFSLSNSPFQFQADSIRNYTFFNCSSTDRDSYPGWSVPCLDVPGYKIYAVESSDLVSDLSLTYCTKMYNLPPLPYDRYHSANKIFSLNILSLKWSEPMRGKLCEAQGQLFKPKTDGTDYECEMPNQHRGSLKKLMIAGIILGSCVLVILLLGLYWVYSAERRNRKHQAKVEQFLEDYRALKPTRYSYSDLKRITNEFKDKLGQGGYGTVFKGRLSNEIHVAVKMLKSSIGNGEEFINEVGTMGRIHHVNVVRLVGFYADGFRRALVYEFLPNESLEKFIFSEHSEHHSLGWEKLQEIALGIAKGIEYLHQGCDQRILHFDIKPHNVLLDDNFNPKISDFGLGKLCAKDQSAISMTAARGTMGYIAPEVFSRNFGNVSYKSDVYSFGMLLLEMVGGRKTVDVNVDGTSQVYFPEWIYRHLEQGEELRIRIEVEGHAKIARKLAIVGLWCIQWYPVDRPSMKDVVQMLEGDGDKLTMPPNPFASTGSNTTDAAVPGRRLYQDLEVIPENE